MRRGSLARAPSDLGSKVLVPLLLQVPGIDLGRSTVPLQSLQCHRVQLVY